ncbi:MAG TPA: 4Fe-4S binding protein [Pirellulaceae bacterium]|nr:4Fe-4S binding protein [Pirellulaceae bacterium]
MSHATISLATMLRGTLPLATSWLLGDTAADGLGADASSALQVTAVLVALVFVALVIASRWSRGRSPALVRLDHFLPMLRKAKKNAIERPIGWAARLARRTLPASWLSDRVTGKPGLIRRWLKKLGPSVDASPLRRAIQAVCFIAFLVLFHYVCWPYSARPAADSGAWPSHYADDLARKERVAAELFLVIDPLVSVSTAIASRTWVWSLASAATILLICVVVPRGFCGYLCPLGTLIDLFDWSVGRRVTRFRVASDGWWVHVKYYLLLGTLVCAACGVLVSGYIAAIPVVTRGFLFLFEPVQTAVGRGWHLVPPMNAGHLVSLVLFVGVLALGFLQPRFWCKYVCPSGAMFSLGNLFRATERKVEESCIHCNKCVEICPFDAIKPDFTTRTTDCTMCQSCGGVCPTDAIKFVERWNLVQLKPAGDPPTGETALGRRGFLSLAAGAAAAVVGGVGTSVVTKVCGAGLDDPASFRPVRPPGSVPEPSFLQMCIRCGECFKACPNNVLHPLGFQQGFEGLWTPHAVADWAGCESSCNACGQVCPTGAIRALPLEEKRVARMGLAIVDTATCLPFAGKEACQLCVDDCHAAGYHAIEFTRVHTQVEPDGSPIEGTGFVAPVVLADKCVGCGLCQTRCYGINVADKGLLQRSAIIVAAGEGHEDRLHHGSYVALRAAEAQRREEELRAKTPKTDGDSYLPDFLK